MAKIKVEKKSIEEKCLARLYSRELALEWWPDLFPNKGTKEAFQKYEYVYPKEADKISKLEASRVAITEYSVQQAAKRYMKEHPKATMVNLSCGFSTVFPLLDMGENKAYNVDLRDVLIARKEAVGKGDREQGVIGDILTDDFSWFDKIEWDRDEGIFFYAIDVFHYMKREDVKRLVAAIADKFRDGMIVFDACSRDGITKVLKPKLPEQEVKDNAGFYFSVDDDAQISKWTVKIVDIWRRPYLYYFKDYVGKLGLLTSVAAKAADAKKEFQFVELTFKR